MSGEEKPMIYCVVPEEFGPELFEKLTDYYTDDPEVTVIVDRRHSSERRDGSPQVDEARNS